jgi:hypothetical protein
VNWLELYLDCTRDRAGEAVTDDALRRDAAFRNHVYRRAMALDYPRCRFRLSDTVCAGMENWAKFTATSDVHALADSMLELDAIEYAQWRGKAGAA